jgi:diguanylate cyclase (GGDEF)-like protein
MADPRDTSGPNQLSAAAASPADAVVSALSAALDARDGYTSEHSSATVLLTQTVGERLGLSSDALDELAQIAALHDIGKLGIPTDIIRKPGPLTEEEWEIMREHSAIGERILKGVPDLAGVARAVRHGHERWDGGGYPDHLAGEEIPLTSRIVFICDAYDAMTSDRPYRPAMSPEEAIRELRAGAGTQFDPQVVQSLLVALGEDDEQVNWPPRETRERAQAQALEEIAAEIGATDLFVLRRSTTRQYAHLAGVGRGDGWAGNIELDAADEAHLRSAVAAGTPICVPLDGTGRVVGPYYAGSAVIVPCADDTIVVFGAPDGALTNRCADQAAALAARAAALVRDVSPAKRLADELEVLEAVRSITTVTAEDVSATLSAVADRTARALSCEFGAAMTFPTDDHQGVIGWAGHGWEPESEELLVGALLSLVSKPERFPLLIQDAATASDLPEGFTRADGVSALHARFVGEPPVGALLVVHAEPRLRGFTSLCQRVARGISDGADVVVRRALAQERLTAENERLSERLHTDTLTGVASRAAWEEILAVEELHRGRSGAISSLVVVDVDRLKFVNDGDGHAAGDDLLRICARLLSDNTRATDVVARIGGDEFAALLRYSDEAAAEAWCERLARRLDALNARTPGGEPLTISVGYAQTTQEITIADALAHADRRMYAQKQARRRSRAPQ